MISGNVNNAEIKIYNILGQTLYTERNVSLIPGQVKTVSLNNFPAGLYFLLTKVNDKFSTQKFVVKK